MINEWIDEWNVERTDKRWYDGKVKRWGMRDGEAEDRGILRDDKT